MRNGLKFTIAWTSKWPSFIKKKEENVSRISDSLNLKEGSIGPKKNFKYHKLTTTKKALWKNSELFHDFLRVWRKTTFSQEFQSLKKPTSKCKNVPGIS